MSGAPAYIVDLTEMNFAEVLGLSRRVPVLVDFWADWCAPCKQIGPLLEKLAHEQRGRFILAKVNADREPLITQQFGVRGLPTLKLVYQGQLAGELVGAQPEAAIRKLLQPFLGEAAAEEEGAQAPDFHQAVAEAVADGRLEDAINALREQLKADKDDHRSRAMLVELLVQEDRLEEAAAALEGAPAGAAELRRPRALVAFAGRTTGIPDLPSLERAVAAGGDTEARFNLALRLVAANRLEEGMDLLLALMRQDRQFREDAARKALLEVLDILGRDDPLTAQYRRRLANALY